MLRQGVNAMSFASTEASALSRGYITRARYFSSSATLPNIEGPTLSIKDRYELAKKLRLRTKDLKRLEQVEEKLGIQQPEDWLTVRVADLKALGMPSRIGLIELADLLHERYPDHSWEQLYSLRGKFALQKRLEKAVASIFEEAALKINARKEAGILNPNTNNYMELDIYLPDLQLAFEFQEKHHYIKNNSFTDRSLEDIRKADALKKELVGKNGITLIIVPCWWDFRIESLAASIRAVRPDLEAKMAKSVKLDASGVPDSPPAGFFESHVDRIEGIGEPMNACFLTSNRSDPTNWWIFEKYDGVRGFWNPIKKAFYSRKGNKFSMPQEIIDAMPSDLFLDGEFWFGRDTFQEAMKIAQRASSEQIDWSRFRYMVFDLPSLQSSTYAERYNALAKALEERQCKYVTLAPYEKCEDISHLEKFCQDVIDGGGEGIILRDPTSPYQSGNSVGFLKHKKFRDAEAKIVEVLGTALWECELPNGIRFKAPAGSTEFLKRWQPKKGDIVSFKHRGFLFPSQKPKLPTIYRIRNDLTWEDVVKKFDGKHLPSAPKVTVRPLRKSTRQKPNGYWAGKENRKNYLIDFAAQEGFDPFVTTNWEKVTLSQIRAKKGGGLLNWAGGSLYRALEQTFDGFDFQRTEEPAIGKVSWGYWNDIENRKKFFTQIAEEMKFDPNDVNSWKNVSNEHIRTKKGGGLLNWADGSLSGALRKTFPALSWA